MNKQEIDKWLDNEYGISYTRLGELNNNIIEYNIKYKEEIKKLKQAVKDTKENADEIIAEQSEEIERLKKELEKQNVDYGIEIERLNKRVKECEEAYLRTRHQYSELETKYLIDEYIINELEKWLEEQIKICQAHDNEFGVNVCNTFKDKLQELKGDSSNEIH